MGLSLRIGHHPILDMPISRSKVTIYFNEKPVEAYEGETVAAALTAAGIKVFHHSKRYHTPRGLFCGIGHCTDCAMEVDGIPNTRICITTVRNGMRVYSDNHSCRL